MPVAGKTVATSTGFPIFANTRDATAVTGFNGVFFGPPGVGKTTLLASIKEYRPDEKVLLFDTDMGRESILDVDVDYVSNLSWGELRGHLDTALALKGTSPYTTYGFDSLSSIYYELLIPKVVGSDVKKIEWPHYAEAQRLLTKFVRDAKSLGEYGINTIFTGHVKEENDGDITNVRLSLPQGVRNEILLIVNHVGYLDRKKNSETRELHMAPPRRVDGPKLRQTQSGKQAPLVYEDPTMSKLLDALKKDK